jgi:hypothetical protein
MMTFLLRFTKSLEAHAVARSMEEAKKLLRLDFSKFAVMRM